MLTNIPNNYWDNIIEECDMQIRQPYDEDALNNTTTENILEKYRNYFEIDKIQNK
jgi:hypothetical protein